MRQIKAYLSGIQDLQTVLLLGSGQEAQELADWILRTGKAKELYRETADEREKNPIDLSRLKAETVIFLADGGQRRQILETIKPLRVIGRMTAKEDYFPLWEACRSWAETIYLEQAGETAPPKILEWHRSEVELSVIVPVYRMAAYLPACIESLLQWKAPYVEYLFVDDGSPDASAQLIAEYAEKDSRIRLLQKENGGCASARNLGLQEARGTYVGFVDADDFVDEAMFRKLLSRALLGNYDYAYCGYQEYADDTGQSEPVRNDDLGEPYLSGTYRTDKVPLLAVKTRVAVWRGIYKRALLEQKGIRFHEDLRMYDDLPFRVEVLFAAGSAVCVPEHLYYYRVGRKGQDTGCRDKRLFVHFQIFEHLDRYTDGFLDKRLQDLLQVIKIQTHGYGLSRIEKAYRKEYIRKAVRQLDRNMGYARTVTLMLLYTGKGNLLWYTGGKLRNAVFS